MNEAFRIAERENVLIGGRKVTVFQYLERQPHPIQGSCYVSLGRFAAAGHDASDHACMQAAMDELYGYDDENEGLL